MKQSRTAAPVSMSASCLPLLCPVVGKAPVLTLRPKQKLPTPSQQALFTLLKQRHERYRTQQESVAADSTAADDRGTRTMYPAAHSVRQFDIGSPYSPNGNLHRSQRTSAASLLSDLECSDLADRVVHRAKVRLKKRHQKRVLSLRAKRRHGEEDPEIISSPGSQILLLREQSTHQKLPSFVHTSRNSIGPADDKKKCDILTEHEASRSARVPVLPETRINGSSLQENVELSSSTMQIHPKWGNTINSTDRDSKPKLRVVYLSERQSSTSESSGIPYAPPATPNEAHKHTHSFKYVPSLHDIKSQRQLKTRLQEMMTKAKDRSLEESQAAKEEERKRKEEVAKLKAQQRAEIYALNKIMTEYEEQKFQASLSVKV